MAQETTQIETRQRGLLGKIILWVFVAFNLLTVLLLATGDSELIEAAIRLWMLLVVPLGLMVLFSRGKKVTVTRTKEVPPWAE